MTKKRTGRIVIALDCENISGIWNGSAIEVWKEDSGIIWITKNSIKLATKFDVTHRINVYAKTKAYLNNNKLMVQVKDFTSWSISNDKVHELQNWLHELSLEGKTPKEVMGTTKREKLKVVKPTPVASEKDVRTEAREKLYEQLDSCLEDMAVAANTIKRKMSGMRKMAEKLNDIVLTTDDVRQKLEDLDSPNFEWMPLRKALQWYGLYAQEREKNGFEVKMRGWGQIATRVSKRIGADILTVDVPKSVVEAAKGGYYS